MSIQPGELIIERNTNNDILYPKDCGRGQEPRDWKEFPPEMMASPDEMDLIPESEWSARIQEMEETKSRLSDIMMTMDNGKMFVNLDQGQNGYCWGHSTTHCVIFDRAVKNQPHVRLSATALCAILMNGQNQGAWCGKSLKGLRDIGVPTTQFWNGTSRDLSQVTPKLRENAALHKVTSDWYDLAKQEWSQEMTFNQIMTALLRRQPTAGDFNWWGHSVMLMDPVEIEPGDFGIRILNSWLNWGTNGTAVLRGSRARADGAVTVRSSKATRE